MTKENNNPRVAMIYRGDKPHPAHRGFAEAIEADLIGLDKYSIGRRYSIPEEIFNGLLIDDYDVYISEGTRAMYGTLAKQVVNNSILIYLAGDQALYKLTASEYTHDSLLNKLISNYGINTLEWIFNKYIDGVIAVSEFSAGYTDQTLNSKPVKIVNPYIQPELYQKLGRIKPSLGRKTAVTVGSYAQYKGQDLIVDAWEIVREEHPNAELKLVGADYPDAFNEHSGVEVMGYVDDLSKTLSTASLYVQPSRADNFPVSVLEAMRGGLPAIVTTTTGNKTEVQAINEDMVVSAAPQTLAEAIGEYFNKSKTERRILSESTRKIGSKFNERSQQKSFQNAFNQLLSELSFDF